jgi:hypothetical protein
MALKSRKEKNKFGRTPRRRFRLNGGRKGKKETSDYAEFALVKRDREAFDPVAWRAAMEAAQKMPRFHLSALDPGPEVARPRRSHARALFIPDGKPGMPVRVFSKLPARSPGFVTGAELREKRNERIFKTGTVIIPITAESTRNVDPRTLHLFYWDAAARKYHLVSAAGVNIEYGYVWGWVSRAGQYAVFGLPLPHVMDRVSDVDLVNAWPLQIIIVRLFSSTGPWQSLGPRHLSCCILDLALDPGNTDRLFAAASDGGVWRLGSVSAYPTRTWEPLTDQQPSLAINCLAVSAADSRVIYYADRSGYLYRSVNRGDTWLRTSSTNLGSAWRLLAHPTDANTVYVASDTGFWCSHTGGATWISNPGQQTLRDGDFSDAAFDPGDPSIIYAGQSNVGLLKSSDGGSTWRVVLNWSAAAAPSWTMIKVAVGGQGTDATRTVAVKFDQEIFVNRKGGRPPTVLGGGPWTSCGKYGGDGYGSWCHVIAVDPFEDDVILAGAQQVFRTSNGGGKWERVIDYYSPHEDQHQILFDPTQRGVVYVANDGGVYRSKDGGVTWQTSGDDVGEKRDLNLDLVTAQFYTAGISGDHAVGDAYHQGLLGAGSLAARDWSGIEGHSWEFANVVGDPVRSGVFYVLGDKLWRRTFPKPGAGALMPIGAFTPKAIAVDERPGSKVVLAADSHGQVQKTKDVTVANPMWTKMPGTFGFRIHPSGGSPPIVSIAFAPSRREKAYALSSGGETYVCADADASVGWSERDSLPSTPARAIAVSTQDEDHVFAISSSEVFRSVEGGSNWIAVPGTGLNTLPSGLDLRSIVAGPGSLYLAAATGVFMSPDEGQHWFRFSEGLPNVEIKELLWTESDLFAVTHGRGLWHHGRYDWIVVPPIAYKPDIYWIIHLWLAIHGGDPAPDAIRRRIGQRIRKVIRPNTKRRG